MQYGGNPVACAAVLGVLSVISDENLLTHSQNMGELFQKKLNELKAKHECIGDVRSVNISFLSFLLIITLNTNNSVTALWRLYATVV